MTQEQINFLYKLTISIHEHEWFGKRDKPRDREEVQEWVSKQLALGMGIYTTPCGMSWGVLTTKEKFDEYWDERNKFETMEEIEYNYWEIHYVSCEGNDRWTIARTPIDCNEYDVINRIPMGGCGDDVAEVRDVFETGNSDYGWDFCD